MEQKTVRILLLEDNPGDARLVEGMLTEGPKRIFEVEWIDRLDKALNRLERGGIDLILTDLHTPDGWGEDLVRQLREKNPNLPVVILTGTYEDEKIALSCIQEGVQDYLFKDYLFKGAPPEVLLRRAIDYALERQKATQALEQAKKELEAKVAELELLNRTMLGREERILELKEKLEALKKGGG